jgi:protein gp37
MRDSKIKWTHHTCNFWYGCTKVSAACDHCYAETMMAIRYKRVEWGGPRRRTGQAIWREPFKWDREAAATGQRFRVFTLSLGDFWDNQVPTEWRTEALDVIRARGNLDWLILSKRPQNIAKMLPADWGANGWPHVWLGATVENMVEARRRIPHLLRVPAPHHWLSCEPLLEPLDLTPWLGLGRVDWVVCGGESGTAVRTMDADWARALLAQCRTAGVPFLMKQMSGRSRSALEAIPDDLDVEEYPTEAGA